MYTYICIYMCNALNASCYIQAQVVHITRVCLEVLTWVSPGCALPVEQVGQRGMACPRWTLEEPLCSWEDGVRICVDIY